VLTIAYLTFKEAVRRRAPIISLLVAGLLLVGAQIPLAGKLLLLPRAEANHIFASIYVYFATDIVKFFASVFGIALASGSISAELERGVLSSILPKPITRLSVYAGKWLGLFAFVAANVFFWEGVIYAVAAYRDPGTSHQGILEAIPTLLLYPAMFVSLALCFSTFASFPLAAGLSILGTAIGWAENILYVLYWQFDIEMLKKLSLLSGYLMPLGRMSRAVGDAMGPLTTFGGQQVGTRGMMGRIFREIQNGPLDVWYIVFYACVAFLIGAIVFGRRDV
jgi:Cu-processing system permease protein